MSRARKPGAKWNDRYKHPSVQAALGDAGEGLGAGVQAPVKEGKNIYFPGEPHPFGLIPAVMWFGI